VDVARAEASPFRTTSHGFLTLSLIGALGQRAMRIGGLRMAIQLRPEPRQVHAPRCQQAPKIRGRFAPAAVTEEPGSVQVTWQVTVEREGSTSPVASPVGRASLRAGLKVPGSGILCKAYGLPESLVVENAPDLEPGPGDVVIAVKAASVNFPDVLIIENKYQVKPPLPFSPGCEAAGVVHRVGAGVTTVKPGDRVMAITGYGAFAEQVVVGADRVVSIPDGMTDVTAGAFLFTYVTSDHAVRDRGELKAGELAGTWTQGPLSRPLVFKCAAK
jgi:hypothetical protein